MNEEDERSSQELIQLSINKPELKLNRIVYTDDRSSFFIQTNIDLDAD